MILSLAFAVGVASASVNAAPASTQPAPVQYADLIVRQRVIIRVPTRLVQQPPRITRWRAKPYKKCISGQRFAGAILIAPDLVDLILPGGDRIRAELEDSCPALDYYSGFYFRPDTDGDICAGRDAIHARSGGECQIRRFRKMVPDRRENGRDHRHHDGD